MMKKDRDVKTEAEKRVDIILEDEEMEELIRKLVIETDQKGVYLSNLNQAIKQVWDETIEKEDDSEKYALTDVDKELIKKADAFMEKYGEELIENFEKDFNQSQKERVAKQYRATLISLCLAFEHEEEINPRVLNKYSKQYLGFNLNCGSMKSYVRPLGLFLKNHLSFVETDGNIELTPEYDYRTCTRLQYSEAFKKFSSQYKYARDTSSETTLCAVWFLNKFF